LSTYSESLIRPKDLLDYVTAIGLSKDTLAVLYHLHAWFRGEMRLGATLPTISIVASGTGTIFIEPTDDSEEWEFLYCTVYDTAHIDVADVVNIRWADQIAGNVVHLQESALAVGTGSIAPSNIVDFPAQGTNAKHSIQTSLGSMGFILKRQSGNPWLRMSVQYTASATVGTRTVAVVFCYLRRKLS